MQRLKTPIQWTEIQPRTNKSGWPPPRDKWVRIEEREHAPSTPCPNMNEGSFIYAKRVIFRAGYWLSPLDTPQDELQERVNWHVANALNKRIAADHPRIILHSSQQHELLDDEKYFEKFGGPITPDMIPTLPEILGRDYEVIFKRITYRVRERWMEEQRSKHHEEHPHPLWLKTFWYYEFPEDAPYLYQIDGKINRQVGRYYPGSFSYGYYDEGDYEPAYLSQYLTQALYRVGYYDFDSPRNKNYMLLVHPLDVVPKDPLLK